jgi:hypothetical protein
MAIIQKKSPRLFLEKKNVFLQDTDRDSLYFNITEFPETLTGGKNAFLVEGSECLKASSGIKFELLDVDGNTIYLEPSLNENQKIFYDGNSVIMSVHVYEDTPIGIGSITILGELETYFDDKGNKRPVPKNWRGIYNVKWTRRFKVNRKLPNKENIRFYRKPSITIEEVQKTVVVKEDMTLTKSGSVEGIPNIPDSGSDYKNWTSPASYLLKLSDGNAFTQSMEENTTITISSLNYSSSVREVLNENEILVNKPYTIDDRVESFSPASYSLEFESIENATVADSNIKASYAEVRLENLKTFTGDVARVKIYKKSRNDLGDWQFVQENKLESTELLRDSTTTGQTVLEYGKLVPYNFANFYVSSSKIELKNDALINAAVMSGSTYFHTKQNTTGQFQLVSGSEYTLSYSVRYSGSGASVDTDMVRFEIQTSSLNTSNSPFTSMSIDTQTASLAEVGVTGLGNKLDVKKNFFSELNGNCTLFVSASTTAASGNFNVSRLSIKNAEQTAFSPDEFTAIIDIPRKNPTEQFDFRTEFYDINNNYIPVSIEKTKKFIGGNQAKVFETAVAVSASGVADGGAVLSVSDGKVNIDDMEMATGQLVSASVFDLEVGDLRVTGSQTIISTTTLSVEDKNILIASGAANSAAADGAGITVEGASATLLYEHDDTSWNFNKPLRVTGTISASGDIYTDLLRRETDNSAKVKIKLETNKIDFHTNDSSNPTFRLQHSSSFVDGHITASGDITANGSGSFGDVTIPDNGVLTIGDGNDLRIYHNGSHSHIGATGTGNLILRTSALQVKNTDNDETMLQANEDGAVTLYHDNTQRFNTTAGGINVSGEITGSGNVKIAGNISGSASGSFADLKISDDASIASLTVTDLTNDRVVIAGGGGEIEDSANLTFDGSNLRITGTQEITGNLSGSASGSFLNLYVDDNVTIDGTALIGTSGTANLYLGNQIAADSSNKGARFHSNNNDFYLDFQGDSTQTWYLRDYDGSGGTHDRFWFDFINGNFSASGDLHAQSELTVAQDALIGGDMTVTGSLLVSASVVNQVISPSISSTTASFNLTTSNTFELELAAGATTHLNIINPRAGQTANILIAQPSGGTGSVAFSPNVKQPNGNNYTAVAQTSSYDVLTLAVFGGNSSDAASGSVFLVGTNRFE